MDAGLAALEDAGPVDVDKGKGGLAQRTECPTACIARRLLCPFERDSEKSNEPMDGPGTTCIERMSSAYSTSDS
jgi:hypothetical protein